VNIPQKYSKQDLDLRLLKTTFKRSSRCSWFLVGRDLEALRLT
jgi:hypothetical protein